MVRNSFRSGLPRRIATLSVHTSPLDQPGTGDAGGMTVYIVEVSRRLAQAGVEVEIFTRSTSSDLPPAVEMAPGVTVRHVSAGPFEGLAKEDLPAQLCAFTAGVARPGLVQRGGVHRQGRDPSGEARPEAVTHHTTPLPRLPRYSTGNTNRRGTADLPGP